MLWKNELQEAQQKSAAIGKLAEAEAETRSGEGTLIFRINFRFSGITGP